ncbi:MAG: DUF3459 domain-containing protein, partial [Acidimicrobiales bacterium]
GRASPALRLGRQALVPAPGEVVAWERWAGADRRVVAVNFGAGGQEVELGRAWVVEVASDGVGEGRAWGGRLGPDQAIVLRPGG